MSTLITVDHWTLLRVGLFTAGSFALALGVRLVVLGTAVHSSVLTVMIVVNGLAAFIPGSEWTRMVRIPLVLSILALLWEPPDSFGQWRDRVLSRLRGWRVQGVMGTRY